MHRLNCWGVGSVDTMLEPGHHLPLATIYNKDQSPSRGPQGAVYFPGLTASCFLGSSSP